ncbi:MAG: TolC family protein [bacterium]|nr:TolC family protein [bacterium]
MNKTKRILIFSVVVVLFISQKSIALVMKWEEIRTLAYQRSPEYQQIIQSYRLSSIQNKLARRVYLPSIRANLSVPKKMESFREELFFNPSDSTYLRKWVKDRDERVSMNATISQELPYGPKLLVTAYEWKRKYSIGGNPYENEYGTSYTTELRWNLFNGNSIPREFRIAGYQQKEDQANYEIQIRNFELKLLNEYIRLIQAKKQFEITVLDGVLADSLLQLATRKYKAGLIPQTDLLQVELSYLERKQAVKTIRNEFEQQLENFLNFLGVQRNEPVEWDSTYFPMFDTTLVDTLTIEGLPEIRIANSKFSKAKMQAVQKRFPLPIQVEGRLFQNWDGRGTNRTLANEHLAASKGGSIELSMTLFDRNEFFLRWEESQISLREAERTYRKSLLETEQMIKDAYRKFSNAKERVETAEKQMQLSKLRTTISEKRFASGTISSRELVEAQQDQMRAELQWLNAYGEWLLAGWTIQWLRVQSGRHSAN